MESKLGPLGTSATEWPIVPAPGWLWWWSIWLNEVWQGRTKYSEKTCPSATSSTTNPTWPDPGLNQGRRGGKSATNRLSYGAACRCSKLKLKISIMYVRIFVLGKTLTEHLTQFDEHGTDSGEPTAWSSGSLTYWPGDRRSWLTVCFLSHFRQMQG
jgi:hypothetical protein